MPTDEFIERKSSYFGESTFDLTSVTGLVVHPTGTGEVTVIPLSSAFDVSSGSLDLGVISTAYLADGAVTPDKMSFTAPQVALMGNGNPYASRNSTTLGSLWSHTIPANTLPGRTVRVLMHGTVGNGSGSSQNLEISWQLGGTEYHRSQSSVSDGGQRPIWIEAVISHRASGAQFLGVRITIAGDNTPNGSGTPISNFASTHRDGGSANTGMSEDETTALLLDFQTRWVTSTTGCNFDVYSLIVEYV